MKKMKNISAALLAGLLLFSVASCNKGTQTTACKDHQDADQNGVCDVCGEKVETSEDFCDDHIDTDDDNLCDICGATIAEPIEYTLTIKDEAGKPIAGAQIKLFRDGEEKASGSTNAEGVFTGKILPGSYTVSVENMPEGWLVEGNGKTLKISADATAFEFTAVDNNPDGSAEKPYFVGEEPLTKVFAAGAELHFTAKGSAKYLVIENADVKVKYNEKEYLPENGEVRILIDATTDTNTTNKFSVINTGTEETSISVKLEAIPGTSDNPFEGKLDEQLTVEASKDQTVYYKWTADKNGYLVYESDSEQNHAMLYNTTSFVVTSYTDGKKSVFVAVKKGDVVSIAVASKTEAVSSITFTLLLKEGTTSDPLPLYEDTVIRLTAGSTMAIAYKGEKQMITFTSSGVTVLLNGTVVEAVDGEYTFTMDEGDWLSLTSSANENIDLALNLEPIASI